MKEQKKVWNAIAPEWHAFKIKKEKKNPKTIAFLKKQKGKVLDFGSGSGRYLTKIRKGEMYLLDFSEEMIKRAKELAQEKKIPAKFFISEMTKTPFKDNFFDAAISIAAIHCMPGKKNRRKAFEELYRVLKKDKEAIIAVWDKASKRFKNAPKEKYVRWRDIGKRYYYLYDENELQKELEKIGFTIEEKIEQRVNIIFRVKK